MQFADAPPLPAPPVEVLGPSLAVDLSWCVHGAHSDYLRAAHPVLSRLFDEHAELRDRVRGFWADGLSCFVEIEVLAYFGQALELRDLSLLKEQVSATLETVPTDLELSSETAEDRAKILDRLARLRRSAALRQSYFDLLDELWAPVAPWWESRGVAAVQATTAAVSEMLSRGARWQQLVSEECVTLLEHFGRPVEEVKESRVVLVPCAFFGRALYLDLSGCTLVGVATTGPVEASRARTDKVVLPLRALSDPTRLAIFDFLRSGPVSVGEVARVFELAQATVSVHIRRLREAGLVTADRRGNRVEITVNAAAREQLANELSELLSS